MHNPDTSSLDKQQWMISDEHADERLDRFLVTALPSTSRTAVQQMIIHGSVLVNGQTSKPGHMLRLDDRVEISQESLAAAGKVHVLKASSVELDIVYKDADLLVINKAAGMVVHPAPGHYDDTLVNALLAHYPELQDIESDERPGIVHRLDRDTSGLILVARNARSQAALLAQMKEHKITKRYLALVEGIVSRAHAPDSRPPASDQTARSGRYNLWTGKCPARHRTQTTVFACLSTGTSTSHHRGAPEVRGSTAWRPASCAG